MGGFQRSQKSPSPENGNTVVDESFVEPSDDEEREKLPNVVEEDGTENISDVVNTISKLYVYNTPANTVGGDDGIENEGPEARDDPEEPCDDHPNDKNVDKSP